jgi:hypothetical protein
VADHSLEDRLLISVKKLFCSALPTRDHLCDPHKLLSVDYQGLLHRSLDKSVRLMAHLCLSLSLRRFGALIQLLLYAFIFWALIYR